MAIFVTFTMGPKEAYFFNSPTHWAWHNLPADVESLFTKSPPIKDVIELTLGENGAYFVSFRDHDGQVYCRHYNLPNPLTTYLYASHPHVIRDLQTLSITLGPYDSFYAHDKTSAQWSNLPPTLEKAILERLESQDAWKTIWKDGGQMAPSFVSLGADGTYFMRTVCGGGSWDLKITPKSESDGMKGTNTFLEEAKNFSGVAGLYLFPQHPQSYVLLLMSGKAFSNLPEHTWVDYHKMADKFPTLVQTLSPIPARPQLPISPQQQPQVPKPHNAGFCPPSSYLHAPHNCGVQVPNGQVVSTLAPAYNAAPNAHTTYLPPTAMHVNNAPGYTNMTTPLTQHQMTPRPYQHAPGGFVGQPHQQPPQPYQQQYQQPYQQQYQQPYQQPFPQPQSPIATMTPVSPVATGTLSPISPVQQQQIYPVVPVPSR
ncbi:hypothetical protein B0J11DRAFT_536469 [Dendryphion nanum]|uniref:Uncharacterized protein n=1 Tax=Dendryphion nanum TaxID=256645 RepID=A0A9P9IFB9_9PLEO|nr:hypothetical protein B0J11DRAFT_536469 [Dendryphion nanum]